MEVGIPAPIQNLLNVTGMTILNNFVAGYGSSAVAKSRHCTKSVYGSNSGCTWRNAGSNAVSGILLCKQK